MSSTNIAVGADRLSRILGFNLAPGNKPVVGGFLPLSIAILGEANTDVQGDIAFNVGKEITSSQQAGELYGWGSPIHHIMEILRPANGGVGGIPTIVYPIEEAAGAVPSVKRITPSGTATKNYTHTVVISGRKFKASGNYNFVVERDDTVADISAKIYDVVNNVLEAPVTATVDSPIDDVTLTAKWKGASSDFDVYIETNGDDAGITYAVSEISVAAGTPAVTTALENFGSRWNQLVINGIGAATQTLEEFENWNGVPSETAPTGRYTGIVFKPSIVLTGYTQNSVTITNQDARKTQCTISLVVAPESNNFEFEVAASWMALYAPVAQSNPKATINGQYLPGITAPDNGDIGDMADYDYRDFAAKRGSCTVKLVNGRYQVQDFITTYRPTGVQNPKFRYPRDLMVDFNIFYRYRNLELLYVIDKVIAADSSKVQADGVIKPSGWKQVLYSFADGLERDGFIARADYMKERIAVDIAGDNPNRFNTSISYERTGIVIINSTMAFADSYFGE